MSDKDNSRRIRKLEEMVSLLRRGHIPSNELRLGNASGDPVRIYFMVWDEETGVRAPPILGVDLGATDAGAPRVTYTDVDGSAVQVATDTDTEFQQQYTLLMS